MSFRRMGWVAAIALATFFEISCGQVYRPVVIPTNTVPPDPSGFHAVFGISANVPFNPGTALQIDVSGDTNIGVANMGINPTHAAILPSNSRVFVAGAGSVFSDGIDVVTSFAPAVDSSIATGLGNPFTFTLPNIGPIDLTTGKPKWYCSYLPDFVATAQSTVVYVANFGVDNAASCNPNLGSTDSVATLNTSTNVISRISYLPAGSHPVALAETPNAQNLYVVNQGSNNVTDLSPTDMSTLAVIPVGNSPAWAVTRVDGQRLYVVTQGDGQLYTIDTNSNAQVPGSPQSVGGPGANFVLYDKSRNRIYVVNPNSAAVYAFSAVTDPPTPLGSTTGAISILPPSIPAGTPPCVTATTCSYDPVTPVSVAALPDGSRFYVASYVTAAIGSPCPDPSVTALRCVIPQVTVFDAGSLAVKTTVFPLLPAVANPVQGVQPFAVAPVAFCAPIVPYATTSARFRMSAAASADSSRVYSSLCDGGSVAIINTKTSSISTGGNNTTDTLVLDLPAPFSAAGAGTSQNPIWLLTGQ